ncbi:hypothetical protein Tco_0627584 [Tanacetum coccineum]|uniref:Retrovirus-related Pol polyprotein from transposon TNT 1-94-like beta-barrel domain-containing protein n=1 Tax=Tanacetum coccineum TaxID=301880 RepID=A0ABQ4WMZ2_9ASTR
MDEINNFQQEPDEDLYQAWERFKELLMKCAIPTKTAADAKVAIQEMVEYSQKWHNGTSRLRSIETSNGLAAIQALLNNLGREIKKVNEKVYVAQVGCQQYKGPHYTKDCPLKEEGKTLKEPYYMQFASTDAAIRNQGASIKTLEIQIKQMSKVLQERGFGSLPSSTKANPRDQVKSILTTIEADSYPIRRIRSSQYITYLKLGLGKFAHTKLTVELADTTVKYPKGISENVLVVKSQVEYSRSGVGTKRFETYVKSKDLDFWHVIKNGDFQPIIQNPETKLDEVAPFEKQTDDLKRRLTKNNKAKMVIYNALPRKEYEQIFMCNAAKEIWKTLLITHQGNNQVKDSKIDLLVQQYEQFVISEDESIDSAFARYNTIITSLKALDEAYSSKNYVWKFLRALHHKWRSKVMAIEESNELTLLSLDELIGNLKVHEMFIKKDSEIVKAKVERKSLALKAKKESSDEECSTSGSKDEEYAMAVRDFKKFFKRRDPNHLIRECPKPPRDKNQKAFVGGSWSDSGEEDDEKVKDETCLVAHASSKVCSESSYFSDENSSIDGIALDNEYDKLCKMSLKIITKNKKLKATRISLENKLRELKDKLSTLEKNTGVDLDYAKCHALKTKNEKLKDESTRLNKFEKSTHCLNEILSNQKPSGNKLGLGFNSFEASSRGTKEIKFVKAQKKACSDGGPIIMGGPLNDPAAPIINMGPPLAMPGSEKLCLFKNPFWICLGVDLEPDEWIKDSGFSKHMMGNRNLFSTYKVYNGGNVIFGSNLRGNIIGKGKQAHASHKAKNVVSTTRCLELLHMDLFAPSAVRSYGGNRYTLVIVDDYSRKVEESLNVTFDETPPPSKTSPLVDVDLDEEESIKVIENKNLENDIEDDIGN